MAVQIPFPLPSTGYALNSKMRINLDFLVDQFNQFNSGSATWDTVAIGTPNNLTGVLTFYNSSNVNYLSFQSGVTASSITFTLPTGAPSASGKYLTSTTGGVMSWSFLSEKASYTGNLLLYADGLGVLQEVAVGSGNKVLVNSAPPTFFELLGTTNQITVTPNVGNFTLSTPQDIGTASSVQFGRVKVDAGTYASPGIYFASSTANTVGIFAEANGTGLNIRAGGSGGSTVFSVDSTGFALSTLELRSPTVRGTTSLVLSTSTSKILTMQMTTGGSADYTIAWPASQGGVNTIPQNDGSGNLTWVSVSAAGGATKALDNLASVAINTTLVSDTNNTDDLGTSSIGWKDLFLTGAIKSGGSTLATITELGYLSGVSSAIQTQLSAKAPTASPTFTGTVAFPDGDVSTPGIKFSADTNTGFFRYGIDIISVTSGGVEALRMDSTQIQHPDGTVSVPGMNFLADTNTGIYRIGTDSMGFTAGAVLQASVTTTGLQTYGINNTFISGYRNRILNGDMRFDQRNGGAAITVNSTAAVYDVDGFLTTGQATDGVFTVQQLTASPPTGFQYYITATVTTADASIGSTQTYRIFQRLEGTVIKDFLFGTSAAKTLTLSFWVKCSQTGTFSGGFVNGAGNRGYAFTYVVNATNTWEYKTVTFVGDTTGTWVTTNASALTVNFSLGAGSSRTATAGSWGTTNVVGATGATDLIATNGATLSLTGIQLEIGSTASNFEYLTEREALLLCQRYYEKTYAIDTAIGTNTTTNQCAIPHVQTNTTTVNGYVPFKVTKRIAPTITVYTASGTSGQMDYISTGAVSTARTASTANISPAGFEVNQTAALDYLARGHWVADSSL